MSETSYHPEIKEDSGLYCFLTADRPCAASCMAYTPVIEERFKGQQFAHCIVLVGLRRSGQQLESLVNIAKTATTPRPGGGR